MRYRVGRISAESLSLFFNPSHLALPCGLKLPKFHTGLYLFRNFGKIECINFPLPPKFFAPLWIILDPLLVTLPLLSKDFCWYCCFRKSKWRRGVGITTSGEILKFLVPQKYLNVGLSSKQRSLRDMDLKGKSFFNTAVVYFFPLECTQY